MQSDQLKQIKIDLDYKKLRNRMCKYLLKKKYQILGPPPESTPKQNKNFKYNNKKHPSMPSGSYTDDQTGAERHAKATL
jgi:hypothetical protein